jgi:general secretion pathway protein G
VTVIVAILGILMGVGGIYYGNYKAKVLNQRACADISNISVSIDSYRIENGVYPQTLNDLQEGTYIDPWGNPYQYLNIEEGGHGVRGQQRRDRNLNPINTDYDFYSMGPDGQTAPQLNSKKGKDDIVRALNGAYIGIAGDF